MLQFPHFLQECPVCGRPLEVRSEYLGRRVVCQHCGGRFLASDPTTRPNPAAEPGRRLLDRADELIRISALLPV